MRNIILTDTQALNLSLVFAAIIEERDNQFKKWGRQSNDLLYWKAVADEEVGELDKEILNFVSGFNNPDKILKELAQVLTVYANLYCMLKDLNTEEDK